jgi:hypothetical protein
MFATVDQIEPQEFQSYTDDRGTLVPIESFPFRVARIFYIHGIPAGVERGGHGHKRCQQFLVCQTGTMKFVVSDGISERTFELAEGYGIFLPVGIYSTMTPIEPGTVLLAICDRPYEAQDYLRNLDELRLFRTSNAGKASSC